MIDRLKHLDLRKLFAKDKSPLPDSRRESVRNSPSYTILKSKFLEGEIDYHRGIPEDGLSIADIIRIIDLYGQCVDANVLRQTLELLGEVFPPPKELQPELHQDTSSNLSLTHPYYQQTAPLSRLLEYSEAKYSSSSIELVHYPGGISLHPQGDDMNTFIFVFNNRQDRMYQTSIPPAPIFIELGIPILGQ